MNIRRILVAIDGSELADRALHTAVGLAERLHAELGVVHVVDIRQAVPTPDSAGSPVDLLQIFREGGQATIASAVRHAAPGRQVATMLREGLPGQDICDAARSWHADLIVLGTHGRRGLSRLVMGSTAEWVLRHSPCPVLVVPASAAPGSGTTTGAHGAWTPTPAWKEHPITSTTADEVQEASEESFPGSDAPGWTGSHS